MRRVRRSANETAVRVRRALERRALFRFGVALVKEVGDDDVPGMAAEMAYRFLFAIFPLLLLTAAIVGLIGGPLGRQDLVLDLVRRASVLLPPTIAEFLEDTVAQLIADRPGTYATIGLVATLWGAAGGVGALIKGLNRAYDVAQPRPTWRRQLIAIGATLAIPIVGLTLLALSVIGHGLTGWLGDVLGLSDAVAALLAVVQVVLGVLLFFGAMSFMYRVLPAVPQGLRDVLPGSIVATVGWAAVTQGFGIYVGSTDRSATYGAFATPIAFLLWLYLVGLIVLVGAEINALLSSAGRRSWSQREAT